MKPFHDRVTLWADMVKKRKDKMRVEQETERKEAEAAEIRPSPKITRMARNIQRPGTSPADTQVRYTTHIEISYPDGVA